jgi:hypothetical protein
LAGNIPQEFFLLCFEKTAVKCYVFLNVAGPYHKAAGRVFDRLDVTLYVKLFSLLSFRLSYYVTVIFTLRLMQTPQSDRSEERQNREMFLNDSVR